MGPIYTIVNYYIIKRCKNVLSVTNERKIYHHFNPDLNMSTPILINLCMCEDLVLIEQECLNMEKRGDWKYRSADFEIERELRIHRLICSLFLCWLAYPPTGFLVIVMMVTLCKLFSVNTENEDM